jgi:hypothetical protein
VSISKLVLFAKTLASFVILQSTRTLKTGASARNAKSAPRLRPKSARSYQALKPESASRWPERRWKRDASIRISKNRKKHMPFLFICFRSPLFSIINTLPLAARNLKCRIRSSPHGLIQRDNATKLLIVFSLHRIFTIMYTRPSYLRSKRF